MHVPWHDRVALVSRCEALTQWNNRISPWTKRTNSRFLIKRNFSSSFYSFTVLLYIVYTDTVNMQFLFQYLKLGIHGYFLLFWREKWGWEIDTLSLKYLNKIKFSAFLVHVIWTWLFTRERRKWSEKLIQYNSLSSFNWLGVRFWPEKRWLIILSKLIM